MKLKRRLPDLSKVKRRVLLILPVIMVCLLIPLIKERIPERGYLNVKSKTQTEPKNYPTNKEDLVNRGYLVDDNLGIAFKLPSGYTTNKNYTRLMEGNKTTLIILGETDRFYRESLKAFEALRGQKETLEFSHSGLSYKTMLYDFTGGLTSETLGDKNILIESETISTGGGTTFNSGYLNFTLSGRALAVGMISEERIDFEFLKNFAASIEEVKYTGSLNPDDLSVNRKLDFRDFSLYVPDSFREREVADNCLILFPKRASGDIFYGSKIIIYQEERPKTLFNLPDSIYGDSNLSKALEEEGSTINTTILRSFKKQSYEVTEEVLTLTPTYSSGLKTTGVNSIQACHLIRSLDSGERVHIILAGLENLSYEPIKKQLDKIIKED